MTLEKTKLADLLNAGQQDDARELIRCYYHDQNKSFLNKLQRISFTETSTLERLEDHKLKNFKDKGRIEIGLSKRSNIIWFAVFLLGIVLFSFIYYNNPKSIVVVSIMGGISVLGAMITGYNLLDRKPKLTIAHQTFTYDYTFKSQISVPEILTTYIYRDYDTVNTVSRLIIYKINSVDPEEWLLYNLEYSPTDIGHLIEMFKINQYK